jgi:hypothetical protein
MATPDAFTFHRVEPMPSQHVADVLEFLRGDIVHPGCHVRYSAGDPVRWDQCLDAKVLCWHHASVLRAPHLLKFALGHTDFAARHLGVDVPLLYSINAFCTRPDGPMRPDIQDWHRDMDDERFVPLFVVLTDGVSQEIRVRDAVERIDANAGDAFFSNTMLEHRGLLPTQERIMFWARWGISDPPASYKWDQMYPIDKASVPDYPEDERLRQSLRLLVTP